MIISFSAGQSSYFLDVNAVHQGPNSASSVNKTDRKRVQIRHVESLSFPSFCSSGHAFPQVEFRTSEMTEDFFCTEMLEVNGSVLLARGCCSSSPDVYRRSSSASASAFHVPSARSALKILSVKDKRTHKRKGLPVPTTDIDTKERSYLGLASVVRLPVLLQEQPRQRVVLDVGVSKEADLLGDNGGRKEDVRALEGEKEEGVSPKERARRDKISRANAGRIPWNKGQTWSEEMKLKIRERTSLAMKDPLVKQRSLVARQRRRWISELSEFHSP
eukprot:TRINITY_DN2247_c0_g1_i2.p1 TRINITY_DN2247_c0_g1~~TRINITY_DN2247_c0_g1_i2.p1  ORF type:complete len:274 (+),score=29.70 TRINITY_DN2247_c0_g1_i2:698-1519(+)